MTENEWTNEGIIPVCHDSPPASLWLCNVFCLNYKLNLYLSFRKLSLSESFVSSVESSCPLVADKYGYKTHLYSVLGLLFNKTVRLNNSIANLGWHMKTVYHHIQLTFFLYFLDFIFISFHFTSRKASIINCHEILEMLVFLTKIHIQIHPSGS